MGSNISTDLVDFGAQLRNPGVGEDLFLVVNVSGAVTGTSPTLSVAMQVDDNAAFSSQNTVFTSPTYSGANFAQGKQYVYPMPIDSMERYARLNYTLGGTTPATTLDAHIVRSGQLQQLYPSGFAVA